MLVLGPIVSVPMQLPGSGLAQGMLLLVCTLNFQRGMSWFGYKSATFEKLYMGEPIMPVRDGVFLSRQSRQKQKVCTNCGELPDNEKEISCCHCGGETFTSLIC
ncbi:hypothetical protein OQX63_14770 [Pedobacter sp. PF22-3]|uniref:hypothetical protein n=1 Tax=Pedobacter sp. PF22-3 TaxID=2994467 RepID=UPI002246B9AE|nr:hypothetical protein [Pedobacter sp. PF22-3]MCX2494748.1 hypothetical protein [Pedobacter sp. PF22-3]